MKNKKNNILILGGDSNLGNSLKENFIKNKIDFISTTRNKKKISKKNIYFDFNNYLDFQIPKKIKTVYICASITSIKSCETEKKITTNINVNKTCKLIKKFLNLEIYVIYFSTNLVFSGDNKLSYYYSKYLPQNEYALQKTMVENFLNNQKKKNFAIIRFGKIIFKNNNLFLSWIDKINKNLQISVVNKKYISPIYYTDALEIIKRISFNKNIGTYQVSAIDYLSYEQIANLIISILNKNKKLIKIIELKKTDNAILVSNINSINKIRSKEVVHKFLLENNIR